VAPNTEEANQTILEPREPEPGARLFVWAVFGVLALLTVAFVARFGTDVPMWDDYEFVPAVVGEQPLSFGWLWEQCNEHRIPLPKLVLVETCRAAGNDVRAGMAASVAVLAVLAALMLVLAGRLPGGARPSDGVFALLLLNLGQAPNLLWSIQFVHVIATGIGTAVLILIAWRARWPGPLTAAIVGVALALLPLCGGTGLLYVPAMACWLLAASLVEARSNRPAARWRALVIAIATIPGVALCVFYLQGFRPSEHRAAAGGLSDCARTALQFLTGGIGEPASLGWPYSGAATFGLTVLALGALARSWLIQPQERCRVFGLVTFLAALLTIAAGVGWGRGWAGPVAGFQNRYVTMAAPLWCWLVIVFRLHAPPTAGGLLANALFVAACVLVWPNADSGLKRGRQGAEAARELTQDVRSGVPPYGIVARYAPFLHSSQDEIARLLPMLRRTKVGPFRFLRSNPPLVETRLPVAPTALSLARWDAATQTAHVTGVDPKLTYVLAAPRRVAGVRIRYAHSNAEGAPARFQFEWRRPAQPAYVGTQRSANWALPTGTHRETTVWIDDVLAEFRIQPDNQPCDFHIDEIVAISPAEPGVSQPGEPRQSERGRFSLNGEEM
jgi:hypothetical protein